MVGPGGEEDDEPGVRCTDAGAHEGPLLLAVVLARRPLRALRHGPPARLPQDLLDNLSLRMVHALPCLASGRDGQGAQGKTAPGCR